MEENFALSAPTSPCVFAVSVSAVVFIPMYMCKVTIKNSQHQTIDILVIAGVNNCGTDKIGEILVYGLF